MIKRTEAVERAMSILLAFSRLEPKKSLAQLARDTGLHKSTILRLINSLSLYGFVNRDQDGLYSIGASVWHLGLIFGQQFNDGETVRPVLRMLADQTGETATFFVRAGNDRVCLYRENWHKLAHFGVEEGMRLRLDTGASGLVLMHFTGDELEDPRLLNANGTANLEQTRNPNIASIATPVWSPRGEFKGALSISGLNTRFVPDIRAKHIPLLENAAHDLGMAMR
ncbi:MAG: IclR family transcriptional regulator [Rhodospirillales bacterium]|tara:strand:+ start:1880 stop:2554 length:675 start_codon:yes stop_codon:yes gene_type:complete